MNGGSHRKIIDFNGPFCIAMFDCQRVSELIRTCTGNVGESLRNGAILIDKSGRIYVHGFAMDLPFLCPRDPIPL